MRTVRQTIEGMTLAFDPASAGDLDATVQFEITGDEPGSYYLRIADRRCSFHRGRAGRPNLTIITPSDVWLGISDGGTSGRDALLDGLYEARGDFDLLLRFDQLFRRPHEVSEDAPPDQRPAGPVHLSGMGWLVVGFVPWILLWLDLERLGLGGQQSVVVPLVLSVALVAYRHSVAELTWFEVSTLVFCLVVVLTSLVAREWLESWKSALGRLALGAIWLVPEALGREPLSTAYSKWRYRRELWVHSTFLHVNAVISLVWGWVFLAQGFVDVLSQLAPQPAPTLRFAHYLLLAPAVVVTISLPRHAATMRIGNPEDARAGFRIAAAAGLLITAALTSYLLSQ